MKIGTILNALEHAKYLGNLPFRGSPTSEAVTYNRRLRQYRAFHARILRMNEEKDAEIARLRKEMRDAGWISFIHGFGGRK